MRLALDTSLLRSVSTRRFFSMLLALEGERVVVLPTVDKEMWVFRKGGRKYPSNPNDRGWENDFYCGAGIGRRFRMDRIGR